MRANWIRRSSAFALVYSITSKNSFRAAKTIHGEILKVKQQSPFTALLLGNKLDQQDKREVETNEGEEFAKSVNALFAEVSAKTGDNVSETLNQLVKKLGEDSKNASAEGCCVLF